MGKGKERGKGKGERERFSRCKFFPVNCAIYSSLCVFYVSQSELRHLQCMVCVCVRVGNMI